MKVIDFASAWREEKNRTVLFTERKPKQRKYCAGLSVSTFEHDDAIGNGVFATRKKKTKQI